jgi:hypothetical protein
MQRSNSIMTPNTPNSTMPAPRPLGPTEGVLIRMDHTGDTRTVWDRTDVASIDLATRAFNDLRKMGYAAFAVAAEGSDGAQITTFDATAPRIIMVPALAGG